MDMEAQKPEDCDRPLFEHIASGDINAAMNLYEPEAVLVVSPGQVVSGHAAIRAVLQGMTGANATGRLDAVTGHLSADGSVAFTRARRSSTAAGPDGKLVTTPFHSVEVVRRQPDGTWRIVIDDPSGRG